MRTLTVQDFSCIKTAEIEINRLTIIIGPQASGKSVLCKLGFYMLDIAQIQLSALAKLESFEKFKQLAKERFIDWFPPGAWGQAQFKIKFEAGDYAVQIVRGRKYRSKLSNDFTLSFSEEFEQQYADLLKESTKIVNRKGDKEVSAQFEISFRTREIIDESFRGLLGKDHIAFQAFVPAGRSFFTSIGRAIAVFDAGRQLDPLTLRFGRTYTAMKDQRHSYESRHPTATKYLQSVSAELLGGQLEKDGETEFMVTSDGRKMPLSALSSGQQELLPLFTFLPWLLRARPGGERLCYIEEPEAHLFPSAQSKLIETLVGLMPSGGGGVVLTTHSPYVLTKVNNLLKAGAISRKLDDGGQKHLETIVPRRAWLIARNVRAYAIKDGELHSILDGSDGLIDACYLDEISGHLAEEFGQLLEMEESLG